MTLKFTTSQSFIYLSFLSFFLIANLYCTGQDFTIAQNVSGNARSDIRGQVFHPGTQGNGTGTIPSVDSVYLTSFNIIFDAGNEPDKLYIYSELPSSTTLLDDGTGGVLVGESVTKAEGEFPYTNYSFDYLKLNVDSTYYAVFRQDVQLEFGGSSDIDGPYGGGKMLINDGAATVENDFTALKFVAEFYENLVPDENDVQALTTLYNSTDGDNWTNSWDITADPNEWYGVTWENGRVVNINLRDNNLQGTIPIEISGLDSLRMLILASNDLTGPVPSDIGQLDKLIWLDLESNSLSGEIPSEIGNLTNLKYLRLGMNEISGAIPTELSNLLNLVDLNMGGLSVTGNVMEYIHNFENLESLNLGGTLISGNIPSTIGSLLNLSSMDLQRTNLSGQIPSEIGNLSQLTTLIITGGEIEGTIPTEISHLGNLKWLSLGENNLSGNIPKELADLRGLERLSISGTMVSGSIPPEIGLMDSLLILDLSKNNLEGNIPEELGQMTMLQTLVLENNNLTGSIPLSFSNLTGLNDLILRNNNLEGTIPEEISTLPLLSNLHLPNNKLSGTIPSYIGSMQELQQLDLSGNQFVGEIPAEMGNDLKLTVLRLSNNQLEGEVPIELENLVNLIELDLTNNNFDFSSFESINTFLEGVTYLSIDPQALIHVENDTIIADLGSELNLSITTGGNNNLYQWFLNDVSITEKSANATLAIQELTEENTGIYHCEITNTSVTNLQLNSENILVTTTAKFDSPPSVIEQNAYSIALETSVNKDGSLYYLALPAGSTAPTDEQIIEGMDSNDQIVENAASLEVTNEGSFTVLINELQPNTAYDLYFVFADNSKISFASSSLNTSTISGISFLENYPEIYDINALDIGVVVQTSRDGILYYVVLPQGSAIPSSNQIKAGKNALDEDVSVVGNVNVEAESAIEFRISGLDARSLYQVCLVAQDTEEIFSEVISLEIETVTGTNDPLSGDKISVFPNPASNVVLIDVADKNHYDLMITDLKGETLFIQRNVSSKTQVDISELVKGVYLMQIKIQDHQYWVKIVKE